MTKFRLGRYVFGLAVIGYGAIVLSWQQVSELGRLSHPAILMYLVGIAELAGGAALLWRGTMRFGAIVVAAVFSIFSLFWVPQIVKAPLVFGYYGNFFEQFSIVVGGVLVLASTIVNRRAEAEKLEKGAYISYGICVATYALYQLFYLKYTSSLVPTWIPPGQMFWGIATTIAFALAAVAILWGRSALLATRLLTLMLILFGLLIWVPACVIHPHKIGNWVENASNLAMAGAAWIVADYLAGRESAKSTA